MTEAQLGSHDHVIRLYNVGGQDQGAARAGSLNPVSTGSTVNAGSGTGHNHSHTLSGTLTGNITTTLTGAVTASGTNSFSPFVIVQYIIKH